MQLDDLSRPATAARPLLGLTLLLVEDSRLASEGLRMLCQRSGARLRRADTLAAADRHLRAYRPGAVMVDLHLPDGSGLDLIARLARGRPRIDAILATSGDPDMEDAALAAGADGFLHKPVLGLAAFQQAVLRCLPPEARPQGPAVLPIDRVAPDAAAFRDDLAFAQGLLAEGAPRLPYVSRFLQGVARVAGDAPLAEAAGAADAAHLAALMRHRLAAQPAI